MFIHFILFYFISLYAYLFISFYLFHFIHLFIHLFTYLFIYLFILSFYLFHRHAVSSPNHSYGKVLQKNIHQHHEYSSRSLSREFSQDENDLRRGKDRESFIEVMSNPLFSAAENHDLDDYRKDKFLVRPISPYTKKPPTRPILKNELSAIFENGDKEMSEKNEKNYLIGINNQYLSVSAPVSPVHRDMCRTGMTEENHNKVCTYSNLVSVVIFHRFIVDRKLRLVESCITI